MSESDYWRLEELFQQQVRDLKAQDREINDLEQLVRDGTDTVLEQAKEIEVLTQERDNALLRIEELELEAGGYLQQIEGLERELSFTEAEYGHKSWGGVNPNA